MVARIIRTAGLSVTFIRDGEELEVAIEASGETALRRALLMLSKLDYLQHDDRLTVLETGGPNTP
jgi:hypothetical protein